VTTRDEYRAVYGVEAFDLDPDEITRRTGLVPHQSFHRGDIGPSVSGRRRAFGAFYINGPNAASGDSALEALFVRLEAAHGDLALIADLGEVIVAVFATISATQSAELALTKSNLTRLSDIGASLVFSAVPVDDDEWRLD
jgi:hypothetical protein